MNNNYPAPHLDGPHQGNDILNALIDERHVHDMFDPWAAGDSLRLTPPTAAAPPGAIVLAPAGAQHQVAVHAAAAAAAAMAATRRHRASCPICRLSRFFLDNRWDLVEFGCGILVGVGFIGFSLVTLDWFLRVAPNVDGRVARTVITSALPVRTSGPQSLSSVTCLLGLPVGDRR